MNVRTTQVLLVLSAFLAGVAGIFLIVVLVTVRDPVPAARASAVGGPFQLTDQNGRTVTDRDLRGHPFLVFFGFTHCPDVCPATLFKLSQLLPNATAHPQRATPL